MRVELTKLCDEYSERTGIKVSYSLETEPMGTGREVKLEIVVLL